MVVSWRISKPEGRRTKAGLNVTVQLLCTVWLLLLVNGWVFYYSWPIDLTDDGRFTLPPETITLLENLDTRVEVVIPFEFQNSGLGILKRKVFSRATRVLEEMERVSLGNFRIVEKLAVGSDPEGWDRVRQTYRVDEINRVYLITTDRREVIAPDDLATFHAINEAAPGEHAKLIEENVVEGLSVALRRVIRPDRPKVLITRGHGEMPIEWMEEFVKDLDERGFEIGPIDLRETPTIPTETRLVIVICQGRADFEGFAPEAVTAIESFVRNGGRLFLCLPLTGTTGLETFLVEEGIRVLPGIVATVGRDQRGRVRENFQLTVSTFHQSHPVTQGFRTAEDRAYFSGSRALDGEESTATLLMTDQDCWLETGRTPRRDAGEATGPFRLAVAAEASSRVIVLGAAYATRDPNYLGVARQFLLNSVFWLTDQEILTSGAQKSATTRRIELDERTRSAFFWTAIIVMPACSVIAGLFAFWLRRR